VASVTDNLSGKQVTYTYDQLNRLTKAVTNDSWGLSFTYDGFGNLTQQAAVQGTPPTMNLTVSASTNQITTSGYGYDLNGNLTQVPGTTYGYDIANRMVSNGAVYDPRNRRVWDGTNLYYYGVNGELIGKYAPVWGPNNSEAQLVGQVNLYFRGRAIQLQGHGWVMTDRLGSVRANGNGQKFSYYPYGGEVGSETAEGRTKFGTYQRDSAGVDYAEQRFYANAMGRYLTPDPGGMGSGGNSTSWNQYAYVNSDPVNHTDRHGLHVDDDCSDPDVDPDMPCFSTTGTGDGGGGGGGEESCDENPYQAQCGAPSPAPGPEPLPGPGPDAGCTNWGCMPPAFSRAMQALTLNQDCYDLFGTAQTRQGKWDPTVVLTSLFFAQDGRYGSVNFNYAGNGSALTTPNGFPLPSLRSGITGTSATISINASSWNVDNVPFNAETLLHEMAHLYNFVRGSGGFAIPNRAELANSDAFDKVIEDKCNIHY